MLIIVGRVEGVVVQSRFQANQKRFAFSNSTSCVTSLDPALTNATAEDTAAEENDGATRDLQQMKNNSVMKK
jgi:hypothetical protein